MREGFDVHRRPVRARIVDSASANAALAEARARIASQDYLGGIDLYEQLISVAPAQSTELLAELYEAYQRNPNKGNRYSLYVSRYFDFGIKPGDAVLDIGSGNNPFPFATILADKTLHDDGYGRAGAPMKFIQGLPVVECSIEQMPFADKEFDFVYCSHVLEHTLDPARACSELMRVAKRGYIETPHRSKDIFLNTAEVSNHIWSVQLIEETLCFFEYTPEERKGLDCNILLEMNCNPETVRERAFSALMLLKSSRINTMLYWEDSFAYSVHRTNGGVAATPLQ
jgi:SAM-dependent methyltransferase